MAIIKKPGDFCTVKFEVVGGKLDGKEFTGKVLAKIGTLYRVQIAPNGSSVLVTQNEIIR